MLLTEVFSSYFEYNAGKVNSPILNIPLKLIKVNPKHTNKLSEQQVNKVKTLATLCQQGVVTSIPPIQVNKTIRGFELVKGILEFMACKQAGIYAIPAYVVTDSLLTEERQRYIIYINDKPTAYFDNKIEAEKQAEYVKKKNPKDKVEVKLGTVKT